MFPHVSSAPSAVPAADQPRVDWPRSVLLADKRLRRVLRRAGELAPMDAARVAASVLPAPLAADVLRRLTARGWLSERAALPFDLLDRPETPPEWRGAAREFARMALFGPAGQGNPHEHRHRDAIYYQLSSEIMREARDQNSLSYVSQRALNHPDVLRDSALAAMIRACIAEREAELQARLEANRAGPTANPPPWQSLRSESPRGTPGLMEILAQFRRELGEFQTRLARYDLSGARPRLEQLVTLYRRYPDIISTAQIEHCRYDLAQVERRRVELEAEILRLEQVALAAAERGDHETAAKALRRLSSIHASQPLVLPEPRFRELREKLSDSGARHEHREAARALVDRERSVAAEIRSIAEGVHRFHETVRRHDCTEAEFVAAERTYRSVVSQVRTHDQDWLTHLMLELDDMLEELHDTTGRAETQVNRFLASVRSAIQQVRSEVREITRAQAGGGTG